MYVCWESTPVFQAMFLFWSSPKEGLYFWMPVWGRNYTDKWKNKGHYFETRFLVVKAVFRASPLSNAEGWALLPNPLISPGTTVAIILLPQKNCLCLCPLKSLKSLCWNALRMLSVFLLCLLETSSTLKSHGWYTPDVFELHLFALQVA